LRQPAVVARLRELLIEPVGTTPEEARRLFLEETAIWGKVIADTGVKLQ
jgi:hypothetical protein